MRKLVYILTTLFCLYNIGCRNKSTEKSEGIITFKVSYPKMDKENFMLDFMPKKMLLKFKDNSYSTSLSAGMGLFKTNFIIDPDEDRISQMVKLIDKKYSLSLEGADISKSIAKLPKFNIKQTEETKKILNYVCKKAIITIDNKANESFTVFYTKKINIENSNSTNQFAGIDGVMLEYQYEKYGICMRFEAQDIKFTAIDESEFDIDKSYTRVSETEMDKEMQDIFDSFK